MVENPTDLSQATNAAPLLHHQDCLTGEGQQHQGNFLNYQNYGHYYVTNEDHLYQQQQTEKALEIVSFLSRKKPSRTQKNNNEYRRITY